MTPEQFKAHERMLRNLPVTTVRNVGVAPAPHRRLANDCNPCVLHLRYSSIKSLATTHRVSIDTVLEWVKRGKVTYE